MTDTKAKDSTDAAKEVAASAPTAPPTKKGDVILKGVDVIDDTPAAVPEVKEGEKTFLDRANEAGIGLIDPLGGERYIGLSPAREGDPEKWVDSTGYRFSKFTIKPINAAIFDRSVPVKDPGSGKFYYPAEDCTSYETCELDGKKLVPDEDKKKAASK